MLWIFFTLSQYIVAFNNTNFAPYISNRSIEKFPALIQNKANKIWIDIKYFTDYQSDDMSAISPEITVRRPVYQQDELNHLCKYAKPNEARKYYV